ncbi:MAG: insulinase family protein [Oscillospiraceae bacterium]|nr:insulinase family protein [Oscillospiraceae bacterium]
MFETVKSNHLSLEAKTEGLSYISIRDTNRKSGRITAAIQLPLKEETAAVNALVPYILKRACRAYPSFTALNQKLALLYGAVIRANVRKLGDNQLLTLTISAIDDRFALGGESVTRECAKLLGSMLFEPVLEDGCFREKDVEIEKRQLKEYIESEINDKRKYAKNRALEIICKDEPYGINPLGSVEAVEALDAKTVTEAWQNILKRAQIVLIITGGADPEPIAAEFNLNFKGIKRDYEKPNVSYAKGAAEEVKREVERIDVQQAKLVAGFRSGIAPESAEAAAARLMGVLLGGTPHSRLFLNVREKLSLCYYCSSNYEKLKGILTVESGLEEQNMEKAWKEVMKQLEEIQEGSFEESEMESAKLSFTNALLSARDSIGSLESWYLSQIAEPTLRSPEEVAAESNSVSREDIIKAANKMVLDTVYLLTGMEA